jgi:predicted nucleic acid-binding Zn ribbon protein
MIKRETDRPLKNVIEELLNAYGWKDHIDSVKLMEGWEKVVGRIIAKHTTDMEVKNGVMYVTLDSSVVRSELHQERTRVVKELNKKIGRQLIRELILF